MGVLMGCYKDKTLGIVIHVYDTGKRTCRCGKETCGPPQYRGWKRSTKTPEADEPDGLEDRDGDREETE